MVRKLTCLLFIALLLITGGCSDSSRLERVPVDGVILALGDSLTYGTGAAKDQSYPAQLQQLSGRTVINAGVPGETSDKTLQRVKRLLEEHRPTLVILCIGGNDILRRKDLNQTEVNIQQIIDVAHQHSSQLVLMAVPEFGFYLTAPEFYQRLADNNNLPLDDETIPALLRDKQFKSDPIHPNGKGYRKLADAIFSLLQRHGAL